jgi:hypothetical protein
VAIALIVAVAAVAGLAVGNAIQDRLGLTSSSAGFSVAAIQDLRQIRGDDAPAAAAIDDSSDYGIRHAVRAPAYLDYGVRHPLSVTFTDTFRLTGPSQVGAALKAQAFTETYRLTGPSQVGADDGATVFGPPGR